MLQCEACGPVIRAQLWYGDREPPPHLVGRHPPGYELRAILTLCGVRFDRALGFFGRAPRSTPEDAHWSPSLRNDRIRHEATRSTSWRGVMMALAGRSPRRITPAIIARSPGSMTPALSPSAIRIRISSSVTRSVTSHRTQGGAAPGRPKRAEATQEDSRCAPGSSSPAPHGRQSARHHARRSVSARAC